MNSPTLANQPGDLPASFNVSVILEQQLSSWGGVSASEVVGVVASVAQEGVIHADEGRRQLLHSGFSLKLYQDEAESYYMNLMGERPAVFVVCRQEEDDEGGLTPLLVTLSYDEASSYMEVDEPVFSVPMPPELYRWVEAFVLRNFVPREKKRRKRENWTEEGHHE
jgi:hypothetical protein